MRSARIASNSPTSRDRGQGRTSDFRADRPEFVGGNSLFGETGRVAAIDMKTDEPRVKSQPVFTTGRVEIFFDGGCLGNPGQKYGSFQVLFDGNQIAVRHGD